MRSCISITFVGE